MNEGKFVGNMGDKKYGKLYCLLAAACQPVGVRCLVRKIQIFLQEAGSLANWNWFSLINTEHLSNIFAIEGEVSNHAQLVEALQRHQKHEAYGCDSFHGLKVVKSAYRKT
ncbi:hypothetical protein WBG78_08170 [Chryseolinea sp. T2]|uniref:hypothetical protein n=1 Tax=Chryseolinea sp. T2 TaxID=3129255 RepID=UPI0030775F83